MRDLVVGDSIALCYCGTPLVSTFFFPKKELYCIECGSTFGIFGGSSSIVTQELLERYEAVRAEWDEHATGKLISPRSWHKDCAKCKIGDVTQCHAAHATDEEIEAHEAAVEWMRERRTA